MAYLYKVSTNIWHISSSWLTAIAGHGRPRLHDGWQWLSAFELASTGALTGTASGWARLTTLLQLTEIAGVGCIVRVMTDRRVV